MAVTLYTKPDCPYCDAARRYLDEQGDRLRGAGHHRGSGAAKREVAEITGGPLTVPITVEDGDVRVGFPYT